MEKAYKNLEFLGSRDARIVRILSEYLEPQSRFRRYNIEDTIVFFGSSQAVSPEEAAGASERKRMLAEYYDCARILACRLTEWSKNLQYSGHRFIVCSGGGPGIMKAANQGASEASGISIGLGISLPSEPAANQYITRKLGFEFHYFFMRKFWFVYLAKGLVVFPGGYGTCDELFELLTLVQTRKTEKKLPIILYGRRYWDEVLNLDAMVEWGTIAPEDLDLFKVVDSVDDAFDFLTGFLEDNYINNDGQKT